ncbi:MULTISPECIES: hypothetical protein [Bacillaceae]|uniref:hypothetical protein n=1 Tax=Bacillus sp. CBEL-1 TaxID=2502980 RepID=UPI0010495BE8|nr:hypothetical protein [Bacillus sp. CBEL-1]TDB50280.1 hypothetical protein EPL02_14555 [Bacillus sp. CBEL-1]
MNVWTNLKKQLNIITEYDVTIMQTEEKGEKRGYKPVHRLTVKALDHQDAAVKVFQQFNIADNLPKECNARFISTGDIILIDEGTRGKYYYKLWTDGWQRVNRLHVR